MKLPYYKVITNDTKYGDSKMFRVRLNPEYADHKGIVAHEETHIKQWYKSMLVVWIVSIALWVNGYSDSALFLAIVGMLFKDLLYTVLPSFRLYLEAEAYRAQLAVMGDHNLDAFANALATSYNANISIEKAKKMIRG